MKRGLLLVAYSDRQTLPEIYSNPHPDGIYGNGEIIEIAIGERVCVSLVLSRQGKSKMEYVIPQCDWDIIRRHTHKAGESKSRVNNISGEKLTSSLASIMQYDKLVKK